MLAWILACLLSVGAVNGKGPSTPSTIVPVDVTYVHATDNTHDAHYYILPKGLPANWRSPIDYTKGTVKVDLEVLTKPSDLPTSFRVCFSGTPKYACTRPSPLYRTPGKLTWSSKFSEMNMFENVDWSREITRMSLIIKDDKRIKPAPENVGAERAALFMPTKLRVLVTITGP
jgi:hypothetical protein